METKFTKGNWEIFGDWGIQDEGGRLIAQFEDLKDEPSNRVSDEAWANAKLIRSAPKLLDALVIARKYVGNELVDVDGEGRNFISIKQFIDNVINGAVN